jgi:hypothetical protein
LRRHAHLPAPSASMPALESRRGAQTSALMANAAAGQLPSGRFEEGPLHTRSSAQRSGRHIGFPNLRRGWAATDELIRLRLFIRTDRNGQPTTI